MDSIKHQFIKLSTKYQVLKFGDYTLKSGKKSNYFFNAGLFNDGAAIAQLGELFAKTIIHYNIEFDVLFGPAYKGIPLATSTAIYLSNHFNKNIQLSFSRKEVKDHGEGGSIMGANLKGQRVLILDDVLSYGTAVKHSIDIIHQNYGNIVGLIVALDRQELVESNITAREKLQYSLQMPIYNIINKTDLFALKL